MGITGKKCSFQQCWLIKYSWIKSTKDQHKALCRVCMKEINITSMGESALTMHTKSKKPLKQQAMFNSYIYLVISATFLTKWKFWHRTKKNSMPEKYILYIKTSWIRCYQYFNRAQGLTTGGHLLQTTLQWGKWHWQFSADSMDKWRRVFSTSWGDIMDSRSSSLSTTSVNATQYFKRRSTLHPSLSWIHSENEKCISCEIK